MINIVEDCMKYDDDKEENITPMIIKPFIFVGISKGMN